MGVVAMAFGKKPSVPTYLAQKGITPEQVRQAFSNNRKAQIVNRYADFAGTSREAQFARRLVNQFGGDERAMFQSLQTKGQRQDFFANMGGILSNINGQQGGAAQMANMQAEMTLMGFGTGMKSAGARANLGSLEAIGEAARSKVREDQSTVGRAFEDKNFIQNMDKISQSYGQIASLGVSSAEAAKQLEILSTTLQTLGKFNGNFAAAHGAASTAYAKAHEQKNPPSSGGKAVVVGVPGMDLSGARMNSSR
jgi:hypothetical protein